MRYLGLQRLYTESLLFAVKMNSESASENTSKMNRRVCCALPKAIQSFCEMGCIYREKPFVHLKCPRAKKTDGCVAPCKDMCDCEFKKGFIMLVETKKQKNEMFLL